ncbi:MAG: PIN domain-containing protein [Planctomycetia bacterium]|nr:PIN domain-containing protein [Planctomycetia bacterium]
MRLVDANILVYAFTTSFPQHERARAWLDERLSDAVPLGLPWPSLLAFVRLTSNQRLFERPASVAAAWRQVDEWLSCEPAWVPNPTPRHQAVLGRLLAATGLRAEHVPDAHLAALALEHGLAVASADTDFSRFPSVRLENPLA